VTSRLDSQYDIDLVYNPEFMTESSTIEEAIDEMKPVVAGPDQNRSLFVDLLDGFGEVYEYSDFVSGELVKMAHNSFLATKVSFANQIRLVAEEFDIDAKSVMESVVRDERISASHLDPTLGAYSGKCLPKDMRFLKHRLDEVGVPNSLFAAVHDINQLTKNEFGEASNTSGLVESVPDSNDDKKSSHDN
jgi:UDPglucose 6-dehydrogenase